MRRGIAPPVFVIKKLYIGTFSDKDSFIKAIADGLDTRDVDALMMRGAIRRFGVMPKVNVSFEQAEKIAANIYEGDLENPVDFQQHYEEMHGKQ